MASAGNSALAARCSAIRTELKAWEKDFAKSHDGRKAGRADIKANHHVAAKYKEYQRLRDVLDAKVKRHSPPPASSPKPKRKAPDPPTTTTTDVSETPTKKVKTTTTLTSTPTRREIDILRHPRDDMLHLSPSKLFSPSAHLQPAMLGPTPQKDGIVLGLFDLLPADSPTKPRTVLGDIAANANLQTPQKRKHAPLAREDEDQEDDDDDDDDLLQWSGKKARMGRTPVSEGTRRFLDQFATPQKRTRRAAERGDDGLDTPSSRGHATTPVFLRRNFRPMPALAEHSTSPRGPRKPRSFTRTLSTILQERRREKEEDARREAAEKEEAEAEAAQRGGDPDDDEEEAMREMMESEAASTSAPAPVQKPSTVLVEDSQFDMKLGADGENASDSEPGDDEADRQPQRTWKKKGAKRQTRRVIMRPVRSRPQPRTSTAAADFGSGDESDDTVAETQHPAFDQPEPPSEDFNDSDSTAVGEDGDYQSEEDHSPKERKVQAGKKQPASAKKPPPPPPTEKENVVKKAARKISAQAHANFRKLKIKNKNSKANGRGWRRNRR